MGGLCHQRGCVQRRSLVANYRTLFMCVREAEVDGK